MDKLSDYFAILKLIEQARKGGRKAGQFNRTLDTGIYNQALSTGMLRGSEGIGGLPASPSEVIDFIPQNKRNPKRAGMEYMSDGGEAEKEYLYGVGPEGSGIGQLLSPLLPVRREIIEPYSETFSDSYVGPDGQIYVDRTVTPGQYGEPEFAAPQALSVLSEVPGMIAEGIASLPETLQNIDIPQAVEQFKRRALISSQAALEGKEKVYDPQTGTVVDSSEALLGAPMLNAPGTAISIARAGDAGGTVLGIMGGTRAKSGKKTKQRVDKLRKKGLEGQDLWDAQSGRKNRGYYAESDGQFRFEIDTSDAKFAVTRPEDIKPFTGTNLEDVLDFPQLYEEYPDLRKLKVTRLTPEMNNNKSVYLEADYNEAGDAIRLGVDPETGFDEATLAALLHEVQHAVQGREGFERGASSKFLYPGLEASVEELKQQQKNLIDNATVELKNALSEEARSILPAKPVTKLLAVEQLALDVSDIRRIARLSSPSYSPEQREFALDALAEKYKGRTNTRGNEYTRGSMQTAVNIVQTMVKQFGDVDKMLEAREGIKEFLPRFHSIEKGARDIDAMSMESGKAYLRVPGEVEARTVESTFLEQKGAGRDVYPTLRTEEYNPEKALDPGQYIYPIGEYTRFRGVPIQIPNKSSVKDKAMAGSLGAAATLGAGATASKIREEEEEPTRRRLTEEEMRAGRIPLEAATGGGVGSMAPVARNMFQGYDIRRGVGGFAPYTRRA